MGDICSKIYWGNAISSYIFALAFVLGLFLVLKISSKIIFRKGKKPEKHIFLKQSVGKYFFPGMYLLVLYAGLKFLFLPHQASKIADKIFFLGAVFLTLKFLIFSVSYFLSRNYNTENKTERRKIPLLPFIRVVIWSAGFLFVLDNFGFDINTLLAGLGIGGVAVALASQAVLRDLFNYFVIVTDRPFLIGDFISVGDYRGTVEKIGIKSTRIASLSGEKLVFSNTYLVESVVSNFSEMKKRRIVFSVQVKYETPLEKLREIPDIIKTAVEENERAAFDRSHFSSFGDWGLVFEAVYTVEGNDYSEYMDIQQNINSRIFELLSTAGVEFAYPTQTIHLEKK